MNLCVMKSELKAKNLHAEEIFMKTGMTQKEISGIVGVSEKTLSNWAKAGSWEEKKLLKASSKQESINNLYQILLDQTRDKSISADERKKTTSAIKDLEDSRTTIPDKIEMCMDIILWMRKQPDIPLELIKEINRYQNEYVQDLIKNNATNK